MPPIIILPLALLQGTAPPPVTARAPPPPPSVIYTVVPPPPPPPAVPPVYGSQPIQPRGNPGNWVGPNDYPTRALREEQEGRTGFRLIVGSDGRVTHCEIRESSGWPTLDQATCTIITRRARFKPATNRRGEPAEGSYASAVRWQIPTDYETLDAGQTGQTFIVEADGVTADCRDWNVLEAAPGYAAQCSGAVFYVPFRDRKGNPVRREVTITTTTSMTDAD